jgi:thiol-disulfide isomerase/thioredoxin
MRKIAGLLLLVSILYSCNLNGSNDKYFLEGTIKNHPAKSVTLEKLGLQKITQVDSAKVDDKGFFKMTGVTETGFYRIKLDDKTFCLFLLTPSKYKFDIDGMHPEAAVVTGPAESDEFERAFKAIGDAQRAYNSWNMAYRMYAQKGVSQDTLAVVEQNVQASGARLQSIVMDSSKVAKNPLIAMFYITNIPLDKFPKENLEVIERMEKEIPNSSYTKDFRNIYNQYQQQVKSQGQPKPAAADVSVGKVAPDIDLQDPNGKTIKLSSLRGKVVLLDFWASWCGPCRMEMPNVIAAYNKYKSKGFTVYSVSLDRDATAWKNAIAGLGMTWENHVSDLKWWQSPVVAEYGVNGIPAAFLLDRNGVIVASNLRGEALDNKLAEILK